MPEQQLHPLSSFIQPNGLPAGKSNNSKLNLPIGSTTGAGAGADLFQGPEDLSTLPPVSSQLSPVSSVFSLSSSSFSLQERSDKQHVTRKDFRYKMLHSCHGQHSAATAHSISPVTSAVVLPSGLLLAHCCVASQLRRKEVLLKRTN